MCALILCQDVWLTGQREICHVLERTRSTYSHSFPHLYFLLPNVVSEIVERLESVPPEKQQTSGKDVRAWALYPINYKVVMEKETCLTLSHRGQLPLTDNSQKDVIFGSEVEEATLHFWSYAWPTPMPTQIFSTQSPVPFLSNELVQRLTFPF